MNNQPLHNIKWVNRNELTANSYNPNHVAKPELRLLKQSILEDGWTQPIVARPDGEIVDGYHRWTISKDPQIAALTDGLVPVVYLNPTDEASQMASTIRHNRARGVHGIIPMAEITRALHEKAGWDEQTFLTRLGMEREEVTRLALHEGMPAEAGGDDFTEGWGPE